VEQITLALVVFVVVIIVQRRRALVLRWQPNQHTWVAVGTGLLAFVLSAALLLFKPGSVASRLVHHVGIYLVCGFIIPWGYTLLVERKGPSALGIRREKWLLSLGISLALVVLFMPIIIFQGDMSALSPGLLARSVVVLAGAGGLFEVFLYYGFIHLRLEKAFGTIPAILVTSVLYVSWHVGTQLTLEAEPVAAAVKLYGVGVLYQSVFGLTYNFLIIWPFFQGIGVLIDFVVNIGDVTAVAASFPWAALTLALMAVSGIILAWLARRQSRQPVGQSTGDRDGITGQSQPSPTQ
jgi:hypothetical protein